MVSFSVMLALAYLLLSQQVLDYGCVMNMRFLPFNLFVVPAAAGKYVLV